VPNFQAMLAYSSAELECAGILIRIKIVINNHVFISKIYLYISLLCGGHVDSFFRNILNGIQMAYIGKKDLSSFVSSLIVSDITTASTSALVYFFAVSRIHCKLKTTGIDLKGEHKDLFISFCSELMSISDDKTLVWNPFKPSINKDKNKPNWQKDKAFKTVVNSNLLSRSFDSKEEYPRRKSLLDFTSGEAEVHSDAEDNFSESYYSSIAQLYSFCCLALRTHNFSNKGGEIPIGDVLMELEKVYGVAGVLAAEIIRGDKSKGVDFKSNINLSPSVASLEDLLIGYVPVVSERELVKVVTNSAAVELIDQSKHTYDEGIPMNILLKGVPGTGKSHLFDKIIKDNLRLDAQSHNIKRINVHAASDNTAFMQGVGISLKDKQLTYEEKRGGVLQHLLEAIKHPFQPYVLILEEIQENSLNELIGDLIYLIEPAKRVKVCDYIDAVDSLNGEVVLLNSLAAQNGVNYVSLPSLVEKNNNLKLVFPENLFVFCTTNYRDDKKIIEDNLMRRFEIIDLYPKTDKDHKELYEKDEVRLFLKSLNVSILNVLHVSEPHPDRFMVGHSRFMGVKSGSDFTRALKKVVDEFKEIRDVDFIVFSEVMAGVTESISGLSSILHKDIIDEIKVNSQQENEVASYYSLINVLQKHSAYPFL
jgi:hypothetical protein